MSKAIPTARAIQAPGNTGKWLALQQKTAQKYHFLSGTLVLVGTCQQGKSALSNFLVNGAKFKTPQDAVFGVGGGQKSHTKAVQQVQTNWNVRLPSPKKDGSTVPASALINVMDTPGVGDNDHQEACHYLNVFENLRVMDKQSKGVSVIALVIKFPTVIDDADVKTVAAYRDMFPRAFDENLVLIITHVSKKKSFHNEYLDTYDCTVADTLEEARLRVIDMLNLAHDISVYALDTMSRLEEDLIQAHHVRNTLFERVILTKPITVTVGERLFPKPRVWLNFDARCALALESLLDGYQSSLAGDNESLKERTGKIKTSIFELIKKREELKKEKEKLAVCTSDYMQTLYDKSFPLGRTLFRSLGASSATFSVQTKFPYTKYIITGAHRHVINQGPLVLAPGEENTVSSSAAVEVGSSAPTASSPRSARNSFTSKSKITRTEDGAVEDTACWSMNIQGLTAEEIMEQGMSTLQGILYKNSAWASMNASVTVYTPNKVFFQAQAREHRKNVERLMAEEKELEAAVTSCKAFAASADDALTHQEQLDRFVKRVESIEEEYMRYTATQMDYAEFRQRVGAGGSSSNDRNPRSSLAPDTSKPARLARTVSMSYDDDEFKTLVQLTSAYYREYLQDKKPQEDDPIEFHPCVNYPNGLVEVVFRG